MVAEAEAKKKARPDRIVESGVDGSVEASATHNHCLVDEAAVKCYLKEAQDAAIAITRFQWPAAEGSV